MREEVAYGGDIGEEVKGVGVLEVKGEVGVEGCSTIGG